jgi:hypothetical protein
MHIILTATCSTLLPYCHINIFVLRSLISYKVPSCSSYCLFLSLNRRHSFLKTWISLIIFHKTAQKIDNLKCNLITQYFGFQEGKVVLMDRKCWKPRSKLIHTTRFQVFWDTIICCWVSAAVVQGNVNTLYQLIKAGNDSWFFWTFI